MSSFPSEQRRGFDSEPVSESAVALRAKSGVDTVRRASATLLEMVAPLDDRTAEQASLLPDWSRKHVLSHLARGADALVNLLTWARTGERHSLYASREARDADIEVGAHRPLADLLDDVSTAESRFLAAADALSTANWSSALPNALGKVPAAALPWGRLTEVLIHLVDLDVGASYADAVELAGPHIGPLLDYVVWRAEATGAPSLRLSAELASAEVRTWSIGPDNVATVSGGAAAMLAWLTGRSAGQGLNGPLPALPSWP